LGRFVPGTFIPRVSPVSLSPKRARQFLAALHPSGAPTLIGDRPDVEFETMPDKLIAEAAGDIGLQALDLLAAELNNLAGLHVDEVVMMIRRRHLVAHSPIAKRMALRDADAFEQFERPVDGGQGNTRATLGDAAMEFIHVGMIPALRKNLGDAPPLAGQ
jgi:hypothetical protein